MQLRIGVLADYASISVDNKLTILNIFTNLVATSEPINHPQMALVTQFEFDPSEAGNKSLRIELVDEDGKQPLCTMPSGSSPACGLVSPGGVARTLSH